MAQQFNSQRLELFGEAVPVAEHIQIGGTSGRTGAFSVSQAGALVYQTGGPVEFRSQIEWLDRSGTQIGILGGPEDQMSVELSPDGTRVLVSLADPELRGRDLWIYDVRSRNRIR